MRKTLLQSLIRGPLTEAAPRPDEKALAEVGERLRREARRSLGRSLSIREVDAGSCNGCELEIHALSNAFYDIERFGLRFVASPRHADVLLVTGPVTHNMREALERTWRATPDPKWVVAAGAVRLQRWHVCGKLRLRGVGFRGDSRRCHGGGVPAPAHRDPQSSARPHGRHRAPRRLT